MTLNGVIKALSTQGINSKGKVLNALKEANIKELKEFRQSITEEIIKRQCEGEKDER